jgi:chemotaxis protein MotA
MGSYAPIYGLLGTLIGVLGLMKYLGDPMAMGNAMAKAITTFYGIFFANFVALPTAGKLETYSTQELLVKRLILEGIVAIKQETYPHVLRRKLEMIIEQSERNAE